MSITTTAVRLGVKSYGKGWALGIWLTVCSCPREGSKRCAANWHGACIVICMTDSDLDTYVSATAAALGLRIDDAWRAEVIANLRVLFANGAMVQAFDLGEHAEPAPVFRP